MQMVGRKYTATSSTTYRYSINGQEKDVELNENITTALYWEYDSRIGRRWNVDPVVKVDESLYLCFNGNPILISDKKGDDGGPGDPVVTFGVTIALGGNQEKGIKLFASFTSITTNNGINLEGGLRLGFNAYSTYKGANNIIEGTASWYVGAVFGDVSKGKNMSIVGDEYKFAGSGQSATAHGGAWGIGGVGMLTSKYKGVNISGYMGTQYIKGNFGNSNLIINHTNDAMMTGFWMKMGLPPILGFANTDWNRTTELSTTLNINGANNAASIYGRVSLFTPKVLLINGERAVFETGEGTRKPDGSGCQLQYRLDQKSHGTFFSFSQVGATVQGNFGTLNLNYSGGNPQPFVQNKKAHGDGYVYPIFVPDLNSTPNQSSPSIGISFSKTGTKR
jgi:hypothetical protein